MAQASPNTLAAPSFQSFLSRVAPNPPPTPAKPLPALPTLELQPPTPAFESTAAPVTPVTVARQTGKPRPSSSVYLSRTSAMFEPMTSRFDFNGNRLPSTDFFLQQSKYDFDAESDEISAMPETAKTPSKELPASLYDDQHNLRESVILLASVMGADLKTSNAEEEEMGHRPLTYMPALERVYHSALNHEQEDDFEQRQSSDFRTSSDKGLAILGLDSQKVHSARLFQHEQLRSQESSMYGTPMLSDDASSFSEMSDSYYDHANAHDYHQLLADQARDARRLESEQEVKAEMRLVPQPLFAVNKHRSRMASTSSDRFHEELLNASATKKLPAKAKPTSSSKTQPPRLPFLHERQQSSLSSSTSSTRFPSLPKMYVSSLVSSAVHKAKDGLATLSSLAEGLEFGTKAQQTDAAGERRRDLKNSIQVMRTCDGNAAMVAARLKAVPLGWLGI